jgi:hypothetical protein
MGTFKKNLLPILIISIWFVIVTSIALLFG